MKIYESVDLYGLKSTLRVMNTGERVRFLYSIRHSYQDNIKGHYEIETVLAIDKKNNMYCFVSDVFFDGHKLVDKVCEKLKIKKWHRILGIQTYFTYDEICKVLDEMPNFFKDPDIIGEGKISKYISFYKSKSEEVLKIMRRPYEIYLLEKEIQFFEKFHESIEDKKKRLEILKKLENDEDII